MFLTKDEVLKLMGVKTLFKISMRDLTLLTFDPQPEHESVMPLLSLSPLNVLSH